ncbi:hypothetical protein DFJ77DRAFT_549108 [Powellomyces hirtus]|nr:hypothetical protein DFJ77DRAFT_549108 [Powellomyces hirtus]
MHVSELINAPYCGKRTRSFHEDVLPNGKRRQLPPVARHEMHLMRASSRRFTVDNKTVQIKFRTSSSAPTVVEAREDRRHLEPRRKAYLENTRRVPASLGYRQGFGKVERSASMLLEDAKLWAQFHSVGNEMIMTKHGRCLFPTLRFRPTNLDPKAHYTVAIDVVQVVPHKFKFLRNGKWTPLIPNDAENTTSDSNDMALRSTAFVNPSGAQTGEFWERNGAAFTKIKLTNVTGERRDGETDGMFFLQSFHQYQPRVHLIKHTPGHREVATFIFDETKFIAVTHYQNHKVNSLKKNYNPHAKGFKDFETRQIASRIRSNSMSNAKISTIAPSPIVRSSPRLRFFDNAPSSSGKGIDDPQTIAGRTRSATGKFENAVSNKPLSTDDTLDSSSSDAEADPEEQESDSSSSECSSSEDESSDCYDHESCSTEPPAEFQVTKEPSSERPSALDLLSSFCSHILETGNINTNPTDLANSVVARHDPRHCENIDNHPLRDLVWACEYQTSWPSPMNAAARTLPLQSTTV